MIVPGPRSHRREHVPFARPSARRTGLAPQLSSLTPFNTQPKLVPNVLPFVAPFIFLLHQIWPSETSIKLLPASFPTLFLSGKQDELIPPAHMRELFEKCPSERKEWREFEQGTHSAFLNLQGF